MLSQILQSAHFSALNQGADAPNVTNALAEIILSLCKEEKVTIINAMSNTAVVLLASFVFPVTQSILKNKSKDKDDRIKTKQLILKKYTASISQFVTTYCMYLKLQSFQKDHTKKSFLGFDKQAAPPITLDYLQKLTRIEQPEIILHLVKSNFSSKLVEILADNLENKIDKMITINSSHSFQHVSNACDVAQRAIELTYKRLFTELVAILKSDTKG